MEGKYCDTFFSLRRRLTAACYYFKGEERLSCTAASPNTPGRLNQGWQMYNNATGLLAFQPSDLLLMRTLVST